MTSPSRLTTDVWISAQIAPSALAELAETLGLKQVINNRPDHEEPGQPTSEEIQAAAEATGLEYVWAPVSGMPNADAVQRVAQALEATGPVLMFCRSGMRSAAAWALARRFKGEDAASLRQLALDAGYDLSRLPL
ncbi:protein tyrosine phosphatase family protein [Brevundimonas phoenicis]|uniref:TIGR01244 family sulfur transferase n=1 Tax=unclassified Brevundimonas TaxID=2622653 RepID=UPI0039A121D2